MGLVDDDEALDQPWGIIPEAASIWSVHKRKQGTKGKEVKFSTPLSCPTGPGGLLETEWPLDQLTVDEFRRRFPKPGRYRIQWLAVGETGDRKGVGRSREFGWGTQFDPNWRAPAAEVIDDDKALATSGGKELVLMLGLFRGMAQLSGAQQRERDDLYRSRTREAEQEYRMRQREADAEAARQRVAAEERAREREKERESDREGQLRREREYNEERTKRDREWMFNLQQLMKQGGDSPVERKLDEVTDVLEEIAEKLGGEDKAAKTTGLDLAKEGVKLGGKIVDAVAQHANGKTKPPVVDDAGDEDGAEAGAGGSG